MLRFKFALVETLVALVLESLEVENKNLRSLVDLHLFAR